MSDKKKPKFKAVTIPVRGDEITLYASPRLAIALELINEMPAFHGIKVLQLIEAVYKQGKKDGARVAFEQLDEHIGELKKGIQYRNPGKPSTRLR